MDIERLEALSKMGDNEARKELVSIYRRQNDVENYKRVMQLIVTEMLQSDGTSSLQICRITEIFKI
jgi:hypothetical protein